MNDMDEMIEYHRIAEINHPDKRNIIRKIIGNLNTLGGGRPKSDFDDDGTLSIAKFTSSRDRTSVERMEIAMLHLADRVGLYASNARLVLGDGRKPVAIIKRFDRNKDTRIHYISAQSFLNAKNTGNYYYTNIANHIWKYCGDDDTASRETKELYKRMIFTILTSNTDNHLKNHGFLYIDKKWVQSPVFDLDPRYSERRQLKIGISPSSEKEISIEAAIDVACHFDISDDEAIDIISEMAKHISTEWQDYCRNVDMSEKDIDTYKPAFENREMELALCLTETRFTLSGSMEP